MAQTITLKRSHLVTLEFVLLVVWPVFIWRIMFPPVERKTGEAPTQSELDWSTGVRLREDGLYVGAVEAFARALASGELSSSDASLVSYWIGEILMDEFGSHSEALVLFDLVASGPCSWRTELEERRNKCRETLGSGANEEDGSLPLGLEELI